jgi:hypothetical protein
MPTVKPLHIVRNLLGFGPYLRIAKADEATAAKAMTGKIALEKGFMNSG